MNSRKIEFTGEALAEIERRATDDDTSFKQAAADLIALAIAKPVDAPRASPESGGVLSVADTDELFDELRARFDAAQDSTAMEAALQAANARADAAEQKLATMKALLTA